MKISNALALLLTAASAVAFAPLSRQEQSIPSTSSTTTRLAATTATSKKKQNTSGGGGGSAVVAAVEIQPNAATQAMAQGMKLLKPIFRVEAQLQAAVLGRLVGGIDPAQVSADIQSVISKNNIVIYTYSLSPFSTEAVRLLTESGHDFEQIELGAEWFLLGAEESVARVELSILDVDSGGAGATSLPKIFIRGKCIGGCAELASLMQNGQFDLLMKQNKVPKTKVFGLF